MLGVEPLREIMRGIEVLRQLHAGPGDKELERFKASMEERFGSQVVPLTEALDDEHGVGWGSSETVRLPLPMDVALGDQESDDPRWTTSEHVLSRMLFDGRRENTEELVLTDEALEALKGHPPPLPDAFVAQVTICAPSEGAIDKGSFRILYHRSFGPSGVRWFGRFCQADSMLHERVAQHLQAEEALRPDVIFAEVVHNSAPRLGNVICRPVLRKYEIPILGVSGVDPERQIPVTDLRVSVHRGRIVLQSDRLNREVIPRITSAIDYSVNGLKLVQFLAALQHQDLNFVLRWRWGALASLPYLPRVTYGKVIFEPATWNLRRPDVQDVLEAGPRERVAKVQALRRRLGFPRFCGLAQGDNVLPVDLENPLSIESLVPILRASHNYRFTELFVAKDLCVEGPDGRYTHELLIPFTRTARPASLLGSTDRLSRPARVEARTFVPGREWLYVKIYAGPANCDRVLRDVIRPLAQEVSREAIVSRWFFVRFGDPGWHLRIRFRGLPEAIRHELIPRLTDLCHTMLKDRLIWRLQFDTYDREVERFGGLGGMELSERIFCEDSMTVVTILAALTGDGGADLRWQAALRGTNALLTDCSLNLPDKFQFVQRRRQELMSALHLTEQESLTPIGRTVRRQLDLKYRAARSQVEAAMHRSGSGGSLPREVVTALRMRSGRLTPILADLRNQVSRGGLHCSLESLLGTYVHLFLNRLLRAQHRKQEFVIYDFLWRYYRSAMARSDQGLLSVDADSLVDAGQSTVGPSS